MKNPEISEIELFGCLAVLQSCGILPPPADTVGRRVGRPAGQTPERSVCGLLSSLQCRIP